MNYCNKLSRQRIGLTKSLKNINEKDHSPRTASPPGDEGAYSITFWFSLSWLTACVFTAVIVYSHSRFEHAAAVHFSYSITKGFWLNIKESD
jgi:hypothetical protein